VKPRTRISVLPEARGRDSFKKGKLLKKLKKRLRKILLKEIKLMDEEKKEV